MQRDASSTANENRAKTSSAYRRNLIWRELVSWFWVIFAFILIEGTVVQARVIPSGSMEHTILPGDHLIVSSLGYGAGIPFTKYHVALWRAPKRQQIVVFPAPFSGHPDLIKRVIGLPGDRVKMVDGRVFIDGAPLDEPYAYRDPRLTNPLTDNFPPSASDLAADNRREPEWIAQMAKYIKNGEIEVPADNYFVLGDNRENSNDSRFWGFVPRSSIIGTPLMIYMSIDAPEEAWEPEHIGERFANYLHALIHPSEVRWKRLFHTF